jgi:mono/diheme cytochrome c family protein
LHRVILWSVIIACLAGFAWAYREDAEVQRGERTFREAGCGSCHLSGGAPNLQNVSKRYHMKKLKQLIVDPESVYRERGMQSLNPGYPRMPKPGVNDKDVDALLAYLGSLKD